MKKMELAIREEGRELRGWNDRGWQEGEGFGRWKELGGQSVGGCIIVQFIYWKLGVVGGCEKSM